MKKIVSIFGTRPEIIKLSALIPLLDQHFKHYVLYTGQHYSPALGKQIFAELKVRAPDRMIRPIKGGFAEQLGFIGKKAEEFLKKVKPDAVLVQGDTNSTLAGALAAARLGIPVVHVEAGCRSGNLRAPEEQNRRMVDSIASFHFAADRLALQHLRREGFQNSSFWVGNTGLDAFERILKEKCSTAFEQSGLRPEKYALATLHRAENTDQQKPLRARMKFLEWVASQIPLVLVLHPRSRKAMLAQGIPMPRKAIVIPPCGYGDFAYLMENSLFVLSDSGGIQEECAILNRPCLVLREETEWSRLIRAKKNFLLPGAGPKERALVLRLIRNSSFYQVVRNRRAPEISLGASKRILGILKKKLV